MVKEGTPGKYLLRAVVPGSRQSLIESHATRDAVDARRAALERAGYNVVVTLADLLAEGEFLMLEARRRLRGAFRLRDSAMYPKWYGFDHERPELLGEAAYGLTEWCNGELSKARLVANPGCYPTSILLALRPLTYLIDREQPVIIDAKSGVSGAGKKADVSYSFAELFGNFKAYGVGSHRHEPEIRQGLHLGDKATLVFVAHLLPCVRGILSTMHIGFTHPVTDEELTQLYAKTYANAPFVRILKAGQLPELKDVVNTPRADIGWRLLQGGRRAVIVSVIDNLLKGAASQAVQNFNRMYGFPETEGLLP